MLTVVLTFQNIVVYFFFKFCFRHTDVKLSVQISIFTIAAYFKASPRICKGDLMQCDPYVSCCLFILIAITFIHIFIDGQRGFRNSSIWPLRPVWSIKHWGPDQMIGNLQTMFWIQFPYRHCVFRFNLHCIFVQTGQCCLMCMSKIKSILRITFIQYIMGCH